MTTEDRKFLHLTLDLATKGRGLASPNPLVGAIVLDATGVESGRGFYTWQAAKHAEVIALEQAGASANDGTLYVSLEPCCFEGRTPACTEAILKSGIRRVVAVAEDPHPKVRGSGFAILERAGVEVVRVVDFPSKLSMEAQRQNEAIFHFSQTGRPLVTLKSAVTLDGKIAISRDHSGWITSDVARDHVQQVRHDQDAILTGIGTALADDCLLTDRTGLPRRRPLMRVVVDSFLRLPLNSKLVESCEDDLIVVSTSAAPSERMQSLQNRGVSVHILDGTEGKVDLQAVMTWLGKQQLASLVIEAGSNLNGALLDAEVVDKMLLYYAPKILGTVKSIPIVDRTDRQSRQEMIQFRDLRVSSVSSDEFILEAYPLKVADLENMTR